MKLASIIMLGLLLYAQPIVAYADCIEKLDACHILQLRQKELIMTQKQELRLAAKQIAEYRLKEKEDKFSMYFFGILLAGVSGFALKGLFQK